MKQDINVAVIVGSLRKESFSKKLAQATIKLAPEHLKFSMIEIGALPLYNEDLDKEGTPEAWVKFRKEVQKADALLFITPEYNRSIPGALKNAIDVGSRPYGKSVWEGKPSAIISDSPSKIGAFGANQALRQTFVFLNVPVMQQPEAYVGEVNQLLAEDGSLKKDETKDFLGKFLTGFEEWAQTIRKSARPSHDFAAFLKKRDDIARDYSNGDAASLMEISTKKDPATFFAPMGEKTEGAQAVASSYRAGAESFHKGGSSKLEILHSHASGDMAFWTGIQHAEVIFGKSKDKTPMDIRITEVFRWEEGAYKLVHRHADIPQAPKK